MTYAVLAFFLLAALLCLAERIFREVVAQINVEQFGDPSRHLTPAPIRVMRLLNRRQLRPSCFMDRRWIG